MLIVYNYKEADIFPTPGSATHPFSNDNIIVSTTDDCLRQASRYRHARVLINKAISREEKLFLSEVLNHLQINYDEFDEAGAPVEINNTISLRPNPTFTQSRKQIQSYKGAV